MTGCHGTSPPFDQIYDMVGNALEFVNSFGGDTTANPMGGAWDTTQADLVGYGGGCSYIHSFNGLNPILESGFRCCADP